VRKATTGFRFFDKNETARAGQPDFVKTVGRVDFNSSETHDNMIGQYPLVLGTFMRRLAAIAVL
jgi:hypothetical protein